MGIKWEQWQKPDWGSWGARLQCWTEGEATEQKPTCFSAQEALRAPDVPLGQWDSQSPGLSVYLGEGDPGPGACSELLTSSFSLCLPVASLCPPTADVRFLVCTLFPLALGEDARCTDFFPAPSVTLEFAYSRFFFFGCAMRLVDLSFPTRGQTWALGSESVDS